MLVLLKKHPAILESNLSARTQDGFMPLQQALVSGKEANVYLVLELLSQYPEVYEDNLMNKNRYGYNCLHQAANSGNHKWIRRFILDLKTVFRNEWHEPAEILIEDKRKFLKIGFPEVNRILSQNGYRAQARENFAYQRSEDFNNLDRRSRNSYR